MHWNAFFKSCGWLLAGIFFVTSPAHAGGIPAAPVVLSPPDQGFALALFKTLCRLQPKANILTSPVSIYSALVMTAGGARGTTLEAMADVLGVDPSKWAQVEKQMGDYLSPIDQKEGAATLQLANAIWTAGNIPLEDAYVNRMEKQFRAIIRPLPKKDPAGMINQWVTGQTHGKITKVIDQIDPNLALLLINAAYFKDAWQTPFPIEGTTEGPFFLNDEDTMPAHYMARGGWFAYLSTKGLTAVRIAYRDPRFSMLVILPPSEMKMDALIDTLTPAMINGWRQRMTRAEGRVVLPRFQIQTGVSLRQPLIKMGMAAAFDAQKADFSGITPSRPFAISDVNHHCFLKVDEAGSEAAAVTTVQMFGSALPQASPFEFIANRPFLCLIEDQSTGRILFMGAVYRPESP
ncbi:proteinase inhibitor I4 serpin [Desulfosarcina variabilis str. Montpellier]|uniref:serpin family protein n=1 Tax=Desulfosarcina variabilis TaxID=2300 RepID=UPI003AFAAB8C